MRIIAGLICIVLIAGCSEKDNIPSGVLGDGQYNLGYDAGGSICRELPYKGLCQGECKNGDPEVI